MRISCLAVRIASIVLLLVTCAVSEQIGVYQQGTIVKMHMGECLPDHGFAAAFSGNSRPQATEFCPEYTLVGDKVVYIIVGKPSRDVLPLAQEVDFRIRKNELALRVDDSTHETRFLVREMILRPEWDRVLRKEQPLPTHYSMPMLSTQ